MISLLLFKMGPTLATTTTLLVLCSSICWFTVRAEEQSSSLSLDEGTRKLALSLLREFSNKTRLAELIANGVGNLERFPSKPVAEIYRNYTLSQIKALELELSQHDHYIYTPIDEKTKEVKSEFDFACQSYDQNGDLKQFEKKFLQTGQELVSLQKMVIRIINSKLEEKLKPQRSFRAGRSWISNMFDRLNQLFLGTFTSTQPETLYKSSEYSQVNKVWTLMRALEKIENVQPTDEQTRKNVDRLKGLLSRLRKIYELNKIASVPNVYLNTEYISPYNYEAMLRLVQLLGAAQNMGTQTFNPVMTLFRTWINFFNGGNIFSALMNPFGGSTTSPGSRPSTKPKYNAAKLKALMQMLEENERRRQETIDRNRQKAMLENLIKNQNKQQQQIDEILKALMHKQTTPRPNEIYTTTPRPPWIPEMPTQMPTRWPAVRPTVPSSPADVLKQLKDQRKHLNELLQELQKPLPNQPSGPNNGAGGAGNWPSSPSWPNRFPWTNTNGTKTPPSSFPTNNDLQQAQQSLMDIMKNITPLINMMGQSGMVSKPRLEQSKFQLLDILNAVNNRELDETSEAEDKAKEMQRVEKLGEKLESVLDTIIGEAEKNASTFL